MAGMDLSGLWTRNAETGSYHAWYVGETRSASYEIKRLPYGKTGWTFEVWRNGERVPLTFSSRLKDAKARAQKFEDKPW
jgi:hypothetical protein